MKIAITGKGGVGKTTLSALLGHLYSNEGKKVIAVDADPDANLAAAFGVDKEAFEKITPIAQMADLIEERTGARPGKMGGMYKLNPKVDDLVEKIGFSVDSISLLIMGKSKEAGSGCYCPENVLLRRLLRHLVLDREDVVIVDMEAGIEHLTRGTAEGVDAFIVVVEPGQRSIQTALTVQKLAHGLGVKKVFVVTNKSRGQEDIDFIKAALPDMVLIGHISFSYKVMEGDIQGIPPYKVSEETLAEARQIKQSLESFL